MSWGRRLATLGVLLALSLGLDRATKLLAMAELQGRPRQSYLFGFFQLGYSENPGSFLSLGADLPEELRFWLLVVLLGLLLAGMLGFALFSRRLTPQSLAGLSLIVGGGLGNWFDRLLNGNVVVDFMIVGVGPIRSGIFNFADLFLEIGIGLILLDQLRHKDGRVRTTDEPGLGTDELR
jgi:signal peptidase II